MPLWISTAVFSVLLAVTFGVWYVKGVTLSIHSIVSTPREGFYWFAATSDPGRVSAAAA